MPFKYSHIFKLSLRARLTMVTVKMELHAVNVTMKSFAHVREDSLDNNANTVSFNIFHPRYINNNVSLILDINECEISSNICQNGGVCSNEFGGFQCQCTDSFDGEFCELSLNQTRGLYVTFLVVGLTLGFAIILLLAAVGYLLWNRRQARGT